MKTALAVGLFLMLVTCASGQNIPKGFTMPKNTISPDGRYGVMVPTLDEHSDGLESPEPKNSLVNLKTGQILATIETQFTAYDRMNHGEILPARWSPDSALLLWTVDGRFGVDTLVVMRLEQGMVSSQTNVRQAVQEALLTRTKEKAPQKYAAAKKRNAGSGVAYPEGFSIDASAIGPVALPLKVRATLDADPKDPEDASVLRSHLEGLVGRDGNFTVTSFQLGLGTLIRDRDGNLLISDSKHQHEPTTKP